MYFYIFRKLDLDKMLSDNFMWDSKSRSMAPWGRSSHYTTKLASWFFEIITTVWANNKFNSVIETSEINYFFAQTVIFMPRKQETICSYNLIYNKTLGNNNNIPNRFLSPILNKKDTEQWLFNYVFSFHSMPYSITYSI